MTDDAHPYPEHDKMAATQPMAQAIGEFIETGGGHRGYHLAEWACGDGAGHVRGADGYWPRRCRPQLFTVSKPINAILADYFGIDLDKIEAEKRAMLDSIRQ